ncbi:hypothetical protein GCM10020000_58060 [Streptomyces olivoverticillatus]
MRIRTTTRRAALGAGLAMAGGGLLAACSKGGGPAAAPTDGGYVSPDGKEVAAAEARRGTGPVRQVRLTATAARIGLGGGRTVATWAYGDTLPGPEIRVTAGDTLALTLANHLPEPTSVHWHGLALRNDMDGAPGLTQQPVKAGASHDYRFTVAHPGTYWLHPHAGVQQDRGLYAPLIVEDPKEPLSYDKEWVVVLDDWVDGVDGSTPDAVLAELSKGMGMEMGTGMEGMEGMHHGGPAASGGPSRMLMGASSPVLGGDAGDVAYPHYLVNGRVPEDPQTFTARPGDRIRIRLVNAGGDTAFRVALGEHRMTITHTDGFPVEHVQTDTLLLGMGERYDVLVEAKDGVFPLTALAEGKNRSAMAVLRTGGGAAPGADARPKELDATPPAAGSLKADRSVRLPERLARPYGHAQADRLDGEVRLGGQRQEVRAVTALRRPRGRAGAAGVRQRHRDVAPHAPARPHLRAARRGPAQGHRDRASGQAARRRLRRGQPGPVDAPLPQRLPLGGRDDDGPRLPPLAHARGARAGRAARAPRGAERLRRPAAAGCRAGGCRSGR